MPSPLIPHYFCLVRVLAVGVVLFAAGRVSANVLDLRNLPGNVDQESWGQPGTTLYAQSLFADDELLSSVKMRATALTGDIYFNILVTGFRFDLGRPVPDFNDIRYNSGMQIIAMGAGLTETSVTPNVAVKTGDNLCIVFDAFSYPASGQGTMRATQFNPTIDPYPLGEFIYLNTAHLDAPDLQSLNSSTWVHRGSQRQHLAIYAEFVPEPTTVLLVIAFAIFFISRRSYFLPRRAN